MRQIALSSLASVWLVLILVSASLWWHLPGIECQDSDPFPTPAKTDNHDFDKARSECYEEVSIWGGRRNGDKQLLECCMGIMMTVCITAKCQQEPLKTSATDLCKREMFDVLPECRKYKKEECDQLRPTWVWIFAIVVVTVVLLALISLIVLVFYRKFYRAGRPKGPIKVRWAGGANVDTHGKKKKKKSKSRSNSSRAGGSRAAPDDASNVT